MLVLLQMETKYVFMIIVFSLAIVLPYIACYYRYYSPWAPEKYKIQHAKWKEAMKRKKESKKASKLASRELAEARKSSKMGSAGASMSGFAR